MKTKKPENPLDRRGFLKLAGLGTTAGVAAALGGATNANARPNDKPQGSGYRETEHVKRYYELAKF